MRASKPAAETDKDVCVCVQCVCVTCLITMRREDGNAGTCCHYSQACHSVSYESNFTGKVTLLFSLIVLDVSGVP